MVGGRHGMLPWKAWWLSHHGYNIYNVGNNLLSYPSCCGGVVVVMIRTNRGFGAVPKLVDTSRSDHLFFFSRCFGVEKLQELEFPLDIHSCRQANGKMPSPAMTGGQRENPQGGLMDPHAKAAMAFSGSCHSEGALDNVELIWRYTIKALIEIGAVQLRAALKQA